MRNLILLPLLLLSLLSKANPIPLYQFIKNEGQWDKEIKFRASIPNGYLLVKENSLQYIFISNHHDRAENLLNGRKSETTISGHAVEMRFLSSNDSKTFSTQKDINNVYHFYQGSDSSKWKTNVKAFEEVIIKDVYPDIDFRLYSLDQSLKYEYIVAPHADITKIKMQYEGMDNLELLNEQLHFSTSINTFKEFNPYSYQWRNGRKMEVKSGFFLENNIVSFKIDENYQKNTSLVIDPELVFSTYSGSSSDNWSHTATYDSEGNLYAGGSVFGENFPVTNGAFQTTLGGASTFALTGKEVTDIVISKYSSDGKRLLYSTFLGGLGSEVPHSLIVNSKDELIVFGTSSSANFPVKKDAFQSTFAGGAILDGDPMTTSILYEKGADMFVTVLSKDGSNLIGSTYIGGSGNDGINDTRKLDIRNYGDEFRGEVYVDKQDNVYVASVSNSNDFPMNQNIMSKKIGYDAVVFSLNRTCTNLLWSTYLGGDAFDAATGIRVTNDGLVYVCGMTASKDLPAKKGALQMQLAGQTDGFVAKFKNFALEQITYIGTSKSDNSLLIDIDKEQNIYLLGLSTGEYEVSPTVYRNAKSGQFIHVLDANLSKTVLSTTFGTGRGNGIIDIVPTAFMVNDCGNIYLSGWGGKVNINTGLNSNSTTTGLPISDDAFQKTTTGSNYYFMILEARAKSLLYATFFGSSAPSDASKERGDHLDGGTCRFDKHGIIYHSACVCKADGFVGFPLKDAYDNQHRSGNCNMAAFKFNIEKIKADFVLTDGKTRGITEACAPANITFENQSIGARTNEWLIDGELLTRTKDVVYKFTKAGEYTIKLKIFNKITCAIVDSTEKKIKIIAFDSSISKDTTICSTQSVQLLAEGGKSYSWMPVAGLSDPKIPNPIAKPTATTKYTATISDGVCSVEKSLTVKVDDSKPDFVVSQSKEICLGQSITLQADGGAEKFIWSGTGLVDSTSKTILVTPKQTTTYSVKAKYADGCQPLKQIIITVDNSYLPKFDYHIDYDCSEPYHLIFENISPANGNLTWDMGDGKQLKVANPENYHYAKAGKYVITLKSINAMSCVLQTQKEIIVPDAVSTIPNVITPNHDGKNDLFILNLPNDEVKIFTRWGKLLFESADYQDNWGDDAEAGTYYYTVKISSGKECKGYVSVLK